MKIYLSFIYLAMMILFFGNFTYAQEKINSGHLRWHVVRKTVKIPPSALTLTTGSGLALSQNEKWLVVGGTQISNIYVFDAEDLSLKNKINASGDATSVLVPVENNSKIIALSNSPRITGLFSVNKANDVFILDSLNEPVLRGKLSVGENPAMPLYFGDGKTLVSAVHGRRISLIDINSLEIVEKVSTAKHGFTPTNMSVRPDGKIAIVTEGAFRSRTPIGTDILILDPNSPGKKSRYEFYKGLSQPRGSVFYPDGQHILIADRGNGSIVVLDWLNRRIVGKIFVDDRPEDLIYLPNETSVAINYYGGIERKITFVDFVENSIEDLKLPGKTSGLFSPFAISPDQKILYFCVQKQNGIAVIDILRKRLIDFIETPERPDSLVMNKQGTRLYVVQNGGTHVSLVE